MDEQDGFVQSAPVLLQHHRVRRELLAERHGDGVLELGAAHLQDVAELLGLGGEGVAQHGHGGEQFPHGRDGGHLDRRRVDVVGGLAEIDVLVRMQVAVVALGVAEQFEGPVGDHLVGVHVRRGPRATLDDVDHELVVQPSAPDLPAGGGDRVGLPRGEQTEVAVGESGGLLHGGEGVDQVRVRGDRRAGDREVLHGTRRVDAPVRLGRHLPVAEEVVFTAPPIGHGHNKVLCWSRGSEGREEEMGAPDTTLRCRPC